MEKLATYGQNWYKHFAIKKSTNEGLGRTCFGGQGGAVTNNLRQDGGRVTSTTLC